MAEEAGGEKVFPATPRKRREARKKGQVARSPDLSAAFVLLAMVIALRFALTNGVMFESLKEMLLSAFSFDPRPHGFDMNSVRALQIMVAESAGRIMAPALLSALVLAVVANVMQVGIYFTPELLLPDFTRLNPMNGVKRTFSAQGAVQLLKGFLKMALISWICWTTIQANLPVIQTALDLPFEGFLSKVGEIIWDIAIHVAAVLFILAAADYAFQRFEFEKNMRMSREELKQEMKQTDGDPLLRQRIRQKQRALAQKRMMQQVPKATVVVTNPTHFAVALRYERAMGAPMVVARGQDLIALRIKEIAMENKVPIVENKPVARALYYDVRLGQEIPPQLYQAVAEILAFVYRGRRAA
jgi:flagellar biosynthetic protein FlhB